MTKLGKNIIDALREAKEKGLLTLLARIKNQEYHQLLAKIAEYSKNMI